jgi:hypothetical protein
MSILHLLGARHRETGTRCGASVGNNVVCGRPCSPRTGLCEFHSTLYGPYIKAATRRAA